MASSIEEPVVTNYGASSSNIQTPKQRPEDVTLLDVDLDDDVLGTPDVAVDQPVRYRFWFQHPAVKNNWKVVVGSWALLIIGIALVACGLFTEFKENTDVQSFVFYIAGVICLIPGIYHVVFIYFAVHDWCKFKLTDLSAFQGTSAAA